VQRKNKTKKKTRAEKKYTFIPKSKEKKRKMRKEIGNTNWKTFFSTKSNIKFERF
jgi:hypothetical protein